MRKIFRAARKETARRWACAGLPWGPADDVEEVDDSYVIELDLPGCAGIRYPSRFGSELAVHGEVKEKERVGVLRRQTRRTGQFDSRMSLPADAEAEHISAELAHGVLTVRVPRTQRAKPRRIEITG
ncbi:Hsp20/alpha crystallin family protein [Streptomyces sp. NPDC054849]